jgi:hypothetical protein
MDPYKEQNEKHMEIKDILQGADIVELAKSLQLRRYSHVEKCKTNNCKNKLQQLQWNKHTKEKDHVKDGGTRFKKIEI